MTELRKRGVQAVVVVGVVTELCVRSTAMSAFERGLFPIIPRECTASTEPDVAREALESIERWYGEIVPLDDLLQRWRASVGTRGVV
jgi:nicotinamidase-related amidase